MTNNLTAAQAELMRSGARRKDHCIVASRGKTPGATRSVLMLIDSRIGEGDESENWHSYLEERFSDRDRIFAQVDGRRPESDFGGKRCKPAPGTNSADAVRLRKTRSRERSEGGGGRGETNALDPGGSVAEVADGDHDSR